MKNEISNITLLDCKQKNLIWGILEPQDIDMLHFLKKKKHLDHHRQK